MNIPSIFIFESENKVKLPPKMLAVFIKNFFRYGRKDVKVVGNRVHLHLSYSPKNETVETKISQLPVRYLRVAADDEEELQLFLRGMKEFSDINFYMESDRKRQLDCDGDTVKEDEKTRRKIKVLENRIVKPSTSTASNTNISVTEIFDIDADEFEGQKYTYL